MKATDFFVPEAGAISLFLDVGGTLLDLAPTPIRSLSPNP